MKDISLSKEENNIVTKDTIISPKMKNKRWLSIEKHILEWEKTLYYNYKKLLSFKKFVFFLRVSIFQGRLLIFIGKKCRVLKACMKQVPLKSYSLKLKKKSYKPVTLIYWPKLCTGRFHLYSCLSNNKKLKTWFL